MPRITAAVVHAVPPGSHVVRKALVACTSAGARAVDGVVHDVQTIGRVHDLRMVEASVTRARASPDGSASWASALAAFDATITAADRVIDGAA